MYEQKKAPESAGAKFCRCGRAQLKLACLTPGGKCVSNRRVPVEYRDSLSQ
jgi:hypothetical protein